MKEPWKAVNQVLGFFLWACVFASLAGSLFLLLVFKWARKVIPAFLKMMAGEPQSYLRIMEDGLVYRNWPFVETRCQWEHLQCIKRSRWFGDALYLRKAEEIGFPEFSINLSAKQIHLSSLVGWPDGGLEEEIRHYAPALFRK